MTQLPMMAWLTGLRPCWSKKQPNQQALMGSLEVYCLGGLRDHFHRRRGEAPINDINMVLDIPVQLSVELGRTKVPIKHILQLGQGSVVELDALAGEPMDVLVNGYLIAQGEVVVVNDKFGIRLTDVVTPSERLRRISKN
jgi:flagellar motor switch protein FliN/FliY